MDDEIPVFDTRCAKCYDLTERIFYLSGGADIRTRNSLTKVDCSGLTVKVSKLANLKEPKMYHGMISSGEWLYEAGGQNASNKRRTMKCHKYNKKTNEWVELPDLLQGRT
mmetsp:Transcript_1332/g.1365  ORF Transcript_1332/g.1365 Transcript_1332/m.1365 type:complete len:110 (+) Transcript_1332:289-618(+)